jgi:hypothetical protein
VVYERSVEPEKRKEIVHVMHASAVGVDDDEKDAGIPSARNF